MPVKIVINYVDKCPSEYRLIIFCKCSKPGQKVWILGVQSSHIHDLLPFEYWTQKVQYSDISAVFGRAVLSCLNGWFVGVF